MKLAKLNKVAHLLGMALIYLGLAICIWVIYRMQAGVKEGQIVTAIPMARIFWWGIASLLTGLPLFISRWREKGAGKASFDASIGLFMTLITLLLLEAGFGFLNQAGNQGNQTGVELPQPIAAGNIELGYTNRANAEIETWYTENGVKTIEATYRTDNYGRRLSPVEQTEAREKFALFFGGSYTFGYLVDDQDTLPSQFRTLAPNYGSNGYGTQQVLGWLSREDLPDQIEETEGLGLYIFLGHHVRRVIGDSTVTNNWGHVMPYYSSGSSGIERQGTLISGRPILSLFYGTLGFSEMARFLGAALPGEISDDHVWLTAQLIESAKEEFEAQFGQDQFYVIIYPARGEPRLNSYLDELGITYFDYSAEFDSQDRHFWLAEGHPSPAGYQYVATRLVQDLALDK